MVDIYNTHWFLFTLNEENNIKGHRVVFVDRDENQKEILLEKIEITASPISCKLYDKEGNKHLVPFIRIKEVYYGEELVWDSKDVDTSNAKVIKGYD